MDNLEVARTELANDRIGDLNPEKQQNCWDESLDTWLTKQQAAEAKKVELDRFQEMGVYEVVARREAVTDSDAILIKARWVITTEGDRHTVKPKARFVAQ